MIWVDYFIIGTIVVSALVSLLRGFVREALSLAIWILAFWVAWTFFRDLAPVFGNWVSTPSVQFGIAFGLLLIVTLLLGGILNYLIGRLIDETGLSGTDRMLGMVFGIAGGRGGGEARSLQPEGVYQVFRVDTADLEPDPGRVDRIVDQAAREDELPLAA